LLLLGSISPNISAKKKGALGLVENSPFNFTNDSLTETENHNSGKTRQIHAPFAKRHLSNVSHQKTFTKHHLANAIQQTPFGKRHSANAICQTLFAKSHLPNAIHPKRC
jgi:hypothetical protein